MKNTASKSTLFLIELVIAILFFAISSAVCVQIFAKAHIYSSETKQLNYASAKLTSLAAYIKTENGNLAVIAEKTGGESTGDILNLYYDSSWQDTTKESCTYVLKAKKLYGSQIQIEIYSHATQKNIILQNVAYHLPITLEEALKK